MASRKPLRLLEHLNLAVPSARAAERFYVQALGCRLNPAGTNDRQVHVNLGCSQFHLPYLHSVARREPVTDPHVVDGVIELESAESLESIAARLSDLFPYDGLTVEYKLAPATSDAARPSHDAQGSASSAVDDVLKVRGPWGNQFRIHALEPAVAQRTRAAGEHAGGSDTMLSIRTITLDVPRGAARSISAFYENVLGCAAELNEAATMCHVMFDHVSRQYLIFREVDGHPNDYDESESKRFHVALYLPSHQAFLDAFDRAQKAGLLYVNPRFEGGPIEFASSKTMAEAEEAGQFRLKDIPGENGRPAFTLEHEVRSPRHKCWPMREAGSRL